MVYLSKEQTLIQRDATGNVIPIEVTLEGLPDKPVIKVTPLLKGELQELYSVSMNNNLEEQRKLDEQIVLKHCIEPKYSEEDIKYLKTNVFGMITTAILSISTGMSQADIQNATLKSVVNETEKRQNF